MKKYIFIYNWNEEVFYKYGIQLFTMKKYIFSLNWNDVGATNLYNFGRASGFENQNFQRNWRWPQSMKKYIFISN